DHSPGRFRQAADEGKRRGSPQQQRERVGERARQQQERQGALRRRHEVAAVVAEPPGSVGAGEAAADGNRPPLQGVSLRLACHHHRGACPPGRRVGDRVPAVSSQTSLPTTLQGAARGGPREGPTTRINGSYPVFSARAGQEKRRTRRCTGKEKGVRTCCRGNRSAHPRQAQASGHRPAGAAGLGEDHSLSRWMVTDSKTTSWVGRSLASVGTWEIATATSRLSSSATSPKMVCMPSSHGVGTVVMKNWDPFVFGPELAMASLPGSSKIRSGWISSSKV